MNRDLELGPFLDWAAPRLGLRRQAFQNFQGTLKKRIGRRVRELGLPGLAAYRERLDDDANEWSVLDRMCRITISRLYRDRDVMDLVAQELLPDAAERATGRNARDRQVTVWSAGCASGEEPYTIALLWHLVVAPKSPGVSLELVATDVDPSLVERAQRGAYEEGSLRELPAPLREAGLRREDGHYVLREELRTGITFRVEDLRVTMPDGPFDLIFCRNLAFTYFDDDNQRAVGARLVERLADGGALVVGAKESIPPALPLTPIARGVYTRARS